MESKYDIHLEPNNAARIHLAPLMGDFTDDLPRAGSQSEFDRAHALLDEIATLRRQERNEATIKKLTELVNSAPEQVADLLNKGIVDLLNAPDAHSPEEVHQKIAAALQIVPPNQYRPEV